MAYVSLWCLLVFVFGISIIEACDVPPFAWCENDTIAEKCKATEACQQYQADSKDKRLRITYLYEALCPDCKRFIAQEMVLESQWKIAKSFVDFEFLPFGNARLEPDATTGKMNITCQHGSVECFLNMIHTCAIKHLVSQDRWFPFVYCMESLNAKTKPLAAMKKCFKDAFVKSAEQKSIMTCVNGTEGVQLQLEAARATAAVMPDKHIFVPWVVINDVSLYNAQMYQTNFVQNLCTWYKGDKRAHGCPALDKQSQPGVCLATDFSSAVENDKNEKKKQGKYVKNSA